MRLPGNFGRAEDFYSFHFSNLMNDRFNDKPLSKVTRDLVEERYPWLF